MDKEFKKEIKEKMGRIKKYLPKGFATIIVNRLEKKGITVKPSVVYFTLDPSKNSFNSDVATEAILLAENSNEKELLKNAEKF